MNFLESIGVTFLAVLCFGIFFAILWIIDDYLSIRNDVKHLQADRITTWEILWKIKKDLKEIK